ncbi:transcriptional regulator [Neoasaia chiangmaiensis NBRC 101099]|uniref:LysR family transcriptional regulator n=1 Tax=Neoasaia chiangmaiensis TaxID=320497 RepID=A0A1U9KPR0_9PROT|nr:LysR family transcriptional regulator [Neoasaia chiangmaiensis]AQS87755.1 LysR family transcriptional regulator [Neoasaia chiangmaiensis]GBR41658.1 transcriptional regulator [Neoasaia chiangmaiensis NBRC 101099]GEN14352.1 transcriptional regulator [Neoasaia chiangmaiensis]
MDIERLDLNLLATLDMLLTERNVTRAARRLNLSQPALSARLARLRAVLGDQLLLPGPRGMVPTARATALQKPLRAALDGVREVVVTANPFVPSTAEGTVAIVASDYVQYAVLMPLVLRLREEAPGIRIAWRNADVQAGLRPFEQGLADLHLTIPQDIPDGLRMRPLFDEDYVSIGRADHPVLRGSLDLETFCSLEHIIVSPEGGGFSGPTDVALAALGQARRVVLSASGFLMVPEMVARSDMVALVPRRIVQGRGLPLQILPPPIRVPGFTIAMAWHDRTTTHPLHRWMRDRIAAVAQTTT